MSSRKRTKKLNRGIRKLNDKRHLNYERLETRNLLAVLTVTNTFDSGAGSLRQALLDRSLDGNTPDTINFNIPGSGVQTITPLTALPSITAAGGPLVLDGTTQP